MTNDTSDSTPFHEYYVRQLRRLKVAYATKDFVNPHNPLWPQQSFDYPYGQAPEVDDLPPEEIADWEKHVGAYYIEVALGPEKPDGTRGNGIADRVAKFVVDQLTTTGFRVYPDLDDATFESMLTEGLFSKFLCELDDDDVGRFRLPGRDGFLKCDLSCMQIINPYWGKDPSLQEYVAPAVVVFERGGSPGKWAYDYKLVGIDIWNKDRHADGSVMLAPDTSGVPFSDADKERWRRAKYFVLQGCLHRLNLIDHVKVHFPHDTINAITKSVLPKSHLVHQLLMPHFWLTLPVNNAVLEGDRSLINRDTWYPWNPFAAKGDEIRKLLPYSWGGNEYYSPGTTNTAYPPYTFQLDPFPWLPRDPTGPGLPASACPSWYVRCQVELYVVILQFAKNACGVLPQVPTDPEQIDVVWLEIKRWAHEIARFLPGFPDEDDICKPGKLQKVIASVIWNAAVVHSFDHGTLHKLMDDPTKPMPFVMRVPFDSKAITLEQELGDQGMGALKTFLDKLIPVVVDQLPDSVKSFKSIVNSDLVLSFVKDAPLGPESLPLCSPADVLYGKMTDLLFFQPHNSSLLYDCKYDFDSVELPVQLSPKDWRKQLADAIAQFQDELKGADSFIFKGPAPGSTLSEDLGLPHVQPPASLNLSDEDKATYRTERCIGAGIQY